ncbi:MAG: DUF3137 domain-containing protein [Flavobacteriaceae bacterium]|nr:DUF3137 domain-containing protein [Flavobacteriaceae bacterium]
MTNEQLEGYFHMLQDQCKNILPPKRIVPTWLAILVYFSTPVVLVLSLLLWIFSLDIKWFFYSWFALLAFTIYSGYQYKRKRNAYKQTKLDYFHFKANVLPNIAKRVYPNIRHHTKQKVPDKLLAQSILFENNLMVFNNEVIGEDFFEGKLDGVNFCFFEAQQTNYGYNLQRGFWQIVWTAVMLRSEWDVEPISTAGEFDGFNGFFLHADFHKTVHGKVYVQHKSLKNILKNTFIKPEGLERVKMVHPRLSDGYMVWASDNQLAQYVLDDALVEAIDNIRKMVGTKLQLSFSKGMLFMSIPKEKNFFENIHIHPKHIEANTLDGLQNELEAIKTIMATLRLNNRIWSKK